MSMKDFLRNLLVFTAAGLAFVTILSWIISGSLNDIRKTALHPPEVQAAEP